MDVASVQEARLRKVGAGHPGASRRQRADQAPLRGQSDHPHKVRRTGRSAVAVGEVRRATAEGGKPGHELQAVRLESAPERGKPLLPVNAFVAPRLAKTPSGHLSRPFERLNVFGF